MAKFTLADGTEVEAFTADEVEARLAETTSGLKSKVEELLGESKSAKQKPANWKSAKRLKLRPAPKKRVNLKSCMSANKRQKLNWPKNIALLKSASSRKKSRPPHYHWPLKKPVTQSAWN